MARHVRGGGSDAIPMPARIVNRMSEQPLRAPYGPASVSYPRRHRPGQRRTGPSGPGELALRVLGHGPLAYVHGEAVFSFLYFLKIKISKIYVRFEIFQKYTPVALP